MSKAKEMDGNEDFHSVQKEIEMGLYFKGIKKQKCEDCGEESYTGLHLCTPNVTEE